MARYRPHVVELHAIVNRSKDWIKQAEKDLEAASDSSDSSHFEWSCFQAQQGAEKAFKALLLSCNIDAWGHGIVHMFKRWTSMQGDLPSSDWMQELDLDELLASCQELDRHYIQPRYPNGFASGYPAEYYNEKLARECVTHARKLLAFVTRAIETVSPPG